MTDQVKLLDSGCGWVRLKSPHSTSTPLKQLAENHLDRLDLMRFAGTSGSN